MPVTARLIRSLALQEKELDWINASRTAGSNPIKIIFSQMMPNLVGITIANGTLSVAANIGIESGLSFLGFGFPEDYPPLGTLFSYATQTQALQHRWWVWLPAALEIYMYATSAKHYSMQGIREKDRLHTSQKALLSFNKTLLQKIVGCHKKVILLFYFRKL
ncbi:ABC transporter permease subunit [Planococcus sp. APC 3900]|uniref:ABC transporter permease subunit n=1 Tax=Planococcus sp. APC 3900 TaxID=3035191 RepID=UPI0025B35915|nr:ABC transporter permease subunit [Planococcus sp. APC 3900]MDN3438404.1 ABC transporter permease subunit [Planococcus sp. APC 3900]